MPELRWMVEGEIMVGYDGTDKPIVKVKTGGDHWNIYIIGLEGAGRIRVGYGCDYNPLGLIEEMANHILNNVDDVIVGEVGFDLNNWPINEDDWI